MFYGASYVFLKKSYCLSNEIEINDFSIWSVNTDTLSDKQMVISAKDYKKQLKVRNVYRLNGTFCTVTSAKLGAVKALYCSENALRNHLFLRH